MKIPIIKNTVTNYLFALVRLLQGILVTRWMLHYLGQEYYGLWSLLWAIFAYALLLDFGFGMSVQKYTASELFKRDIRKYNTIISAIFSFHAMMSAVIIVASIVASFFLDRIFNITDPDKLRYCRICFLYFAVGSAVAFPTGIFPEILVGSHHLYWRNYVNTVGKIVELVATLAIFLLGGKVLSLITLALILWMGNNLVMASLIPRCIPGFRISFRIDIPTCREIANFSWFVYLTSIAKLVRNRSSHILISIFSGLTSVGIYHLSNRLSDLCFLACAQYQENISPVTATLHSNGERESLKQFIFHSMRWMSCLGICIMLPAYVFTEEALSVLFKIDSTEVVFYTHLSLILAYAQLAFRQVMHSFLLMSGWHRFLSYSVFAEAIANLVMNILLLPHFGIVSVFWNAIAIKLLISLILFFPATFSALKLFWGRVFWNVYLLPFLLAAPGTVLAVLFRNRFRSLFGDFLTAACGSIILSGIFAALAFCFLLKKEEKAMIFSKIRTIFPGRA